MISKTSFSSVETWPWVIHYMLHSTCTDLKKLFFSVSFASDSKSVSIFKVYDSGTFEPIRQQFKTYASSLSLLECFQFERVTSETWRSRNTASWFCDMSRPSLFCIQSSHLFPEKGLVLRNPVTTARICFVLHFIWVFSPFTDSNFSKRDITVTVSCLPSSLGVNLAVT